MIEIEKYFSKILTETENVETRIRATIHLFSSIVQEYYLMDNEFYSFLKKRKDLITNYNYNKNDSVHLFIQSILFGKNSCLVDVELPNKLETKTIEILYF